jgi:hypothetical protein
MPDWITIPTSIARPASGGKVALTVACEWHRDDSALPSDISVANGETRLHLLSDALTLTPAAPSATLTFLNSYAQTTTLNSAGTVTQTTAGVFPGAGTYLVGVAGVRPSATVDLSIDAGAGQTVTEIFEDSASSFFSMHYFWVTTAGAGDITIRNNGTANSTQRRISIRQASGLTFTGRIANGAGGNVVNAQTVTLASVPSGWWVASDVFYDGSSAAAPAITWGGSLVSADENFDALQSSTRNVSGAMKQASSTGNFVTTSSISGDDGTWSWRMMSIALGPA